MDAVNHVELHHFMKFRYIVKNNQATPSSRAYYVYTSLCLILQLYFREITSKDRHIMLKIRSNIIYWIIFNFWWFDKFKNQTTEIPKLPLYNSKTYISFSTSLFLEKLLFVFCHFICADRVQWIFLHHMPCFMKWPQSSWNDRFP